MPRSRVTSQRSTACSETWLSHISGARSPPPNHQCCKCRSRQCARARIKTPASGAWLEKALLACGCVLRWLLAVGEGLGELPRGGRLPNPSAMGVACCDVITLGIAYDRAGWAASCMRRPCGSPTPR
jgi:hypothetical protein